eukprot:1089596-Amphidinium_carterae.2
MDRADKSIIDAFMGNFITMRITESQQADAQNIALTKDRGITSSKGVTINVYNQSSSHRADVR